MRLLESQICPQRVLGWAPEPRRRSGLQKFSQHPSEAGGVIESRLRLQVKQVAGSRVAAPPNHGSEGPRAGPQRLCTARCERPWLQAYALVEGLGRCRSSFSKTPLLEKRGAVWNQLATCQSVQSIGASVILTSAPSLNFSNFKCPFPCRMMAAQKVPEGWSLKTWDSGKTLTIPMSLAENHGGSTCADRVQTLFRAATVQDLFVEVETLSFHTAGEARKRRSKLLLNTFF